jgi:hypothetical protein
MIAAAIAAIACAHPNEVPLPGESPATTTRPPTTASTTSGTDETRSVCEQALAASNTAKAEITAQISSAQANPNTAPQALLVVRAKATEWKGQLEDLRAKQVQAPVKAALDEGIALLDRLLGLSPSEIASQATQAQADIEAFLAKLESACG